MNLQTKLIALRKKKGLTQLDLAEKLNVSRQAVSRWEMGGAVPSIDNLKLLSKLYGVSVDSLLDDDAEEVCKRDESKASQVETQNRNPYRGVLLFAVAAAMVIGIFLTMVLRSEDPQVIPMEDMETIIEDDYPTETFSITG